MDGEKITYLKMYWETALIDYDFLERWRNASNEAKDFWKALAGL